MRAQELSGKSNTEKKEQTLQRKSIQRGPEPSELNEGLSIISNQIDTGSSPDSSSSILDTPEPSYSVNASQRANIVGQLQQKYGNAHIKRVIQAKFTVGQPNDSCEQEADSLADEVTRTSDARVEPQPEEKKRISQPRGVSGQIVKVSSDIESRINAIRGGGQSLPKSERDFFEPRFGYDFSNVRIHSDPKATKMARELNARAFTVGRDIVFGAAQCAPDTRQGERLLAHELVHVVQQARNPRIQASNHEPLSERKRDLVK